MLKKKLKIKKYLKKKRAFVAIIHISATTPEETSTLAFVLPALLVCGRKNFHGVYLNNIYFGWTQKAADVGGERRRHFLSFFFFLIRVSARAVSS